MNIQGLGLESVLPILGKSSRAREALAKFIGEKNAQSALEMVVSGKLSGTQGDQIHDFFSDEIGNEATSVWDGIRRVQDEEYGFGVHEYVGIYFVTAIEYDPVGYFISLADALSYIDSNWDDVEEA